VTASFTILAAHLRELADRAASVVPSAGFQPVLRNLLVEVKPGSIQVSGTDLDLSVIAASTVVSAESPVTFMVPAQRLRDILKEVSEGDVQVTIPEASEGVRRVRLAASGAEWDVQVPESSFPVLPSLDSTAFSSFPAAPLIAALKAVRFAASNDGANLGLACVTIARNGDGTAKVTASDGARLQQTRLATFPVSVQIPAIGSPAAVDEVSRLLSRNPDLETAEVAATDSWLAFRHGSSTFACRRLVARAADVENQIIRPAMDNRRELVVPRPGLLEAIRRVRISADSSTSAIALKLSGSVLTVLAHDKQGNTARQQLAASWDGPARSMVVHHRYLTEAVAASASPQCRILLSDEAGRRGVLLLQDDGSGVTGVVSQMAGRFVGY
jgi:DNA polymerase III subunit beta